MKELREILYEYANAHGGGLPLTAEEVCNAVVQWVQEYTKSVTVDKLLGLIKGSETVVVDESENGYSIEVRADYENIVNPLERAIKTPLDPLVVPSVPVVAVNGNVTYRPLSLMGGTKLYNHKVLGLEMNSGHTFALYFITNYPNKLSGTSLVDMIYGTVNQYFVTNIVFVDETNGDRIFCRGTAIYYGDPVLSASGINHNLILKNGTEYKPSYGSVIDMRYTADSSYTITEL